MTVVIPPPEQWSLVRQQWWETPGIDVKNGDLGDAEVQALDAQARELWPIPPWAREVRVQMPKWGVEMCAHRWLDALDLLMRQIIAQQSWPFAAGHCGDVPGVLYQQAETLAASVECWLEDESELTELDRDVASCLGERTDDKIMAGTCFVAMMRARFAEEAGWDELSEMAASWAEQAEVNPALARILSDKVKLYENLGCACGYTLAEQFLDFVRLIGADDEAVALRLRRGVCNPQLYRVLDLDPLRVETTVGYLWGWKAALDGMEEGWLRDVVPQIAGAAVHARNLMAPVVENGALGRWLVGSLLKTTKIWQERALEMLARYEIDVPDHLSVLPTLV